MKLDQTEAIRSSESLRIAALNASHKRGAAVASRRVFMRWTGWFLWRWLLPLVGVVTVLAFVAALASYCWWGAAKTAERLNLAHGWLSMQLDLPQVTLKPSAEQQIKADAQPQELKAINSSTAENVTSSTSIMHPLILDSHLSVVPSISPSVSPSVSPLSPPTLKPNATGSQP